MTSMSMSETQLLLGWTVTCPLAVSGAHLNLGAGGFEGDLGMFVAIFLTGSASVWIRGKPR